LEENPARWSGCAAGNGYGEKRKRQMVKVKGDGRLKPRVMPLHDRAMKEWEEGNT